MRYSLTLSGFGDEPITSVEAAGWARIDGSDLLGDIGGMVEEAREKAEEITGLLLRSCTLVQLQDGLADPVRLMRSPVRSVTSVTYKDTAGATQTLSPALYELRERLGIFEIVKTYDATWPDILPGSFITITCAAGYATADAVPVSIRNVLKRMAAHLYENRGLGGGLDAFAAQLISYRINYF